MSSDDESEFNERIGFYGEDGEWYDRRDVHNTKEDQIYGIFVDEGKRTHNCKPPQRRRTESYSSSLHFNFIQGGIQTVNDDERMEDTHTTHSQSSILKEWQSIQRQKRDLHAMRHGPQLGQHGLPQELGNSNKNKRETRAQDMNPVIGLKKDKGYAKWTKNEKRGKFGGLSFAERYLKKHGFKGRLGAASQGIANPIKQSKARKYNEGLGFNGMDEAHAQYQPKNLDEELKEIEKKTLIEKERMHQKREMVHIIHTQQQPKKKRKTSFKTASHYYETQRQNDTIIINAADHSSDICPAFRHNVNRICDLIQERKEILHREGENMKDNKHRVKLQLDRLTKERAIRDARNHKLSELKGLINGLQVSSLNALYRVFNELQNTFHGDYVQYRLWRLFVYVLFPKIKEALQLKDVDRFIQVLMRWKPLLCRDNVYRLLIEEVVIPKIRKELYEWHPLQTESNERFVQLFKKLNDVMPAERYQRLLSELIIPRLHYVWQQCDIERITPCAVVWDFVFVDPIDDILTTSVTKKLKQFWREYTNDTIQDAVCYIETLKQWRSVLLNIKMYHDIIQRIVTKRLNEILAQCVQLMSHNSVNTAHIEQRLSTVHVWFVHSVFSVERYIELLQNGFFDAWLRLIYQRLNDIDANTDTDTIQFIWNHLFAVIKNHLFKTEDGAINDWMQHYLSCALDMIHFVISNRHDTLPSFDIILKSQNVRTREKKKKKKKKKKRKERWTNEYKRDMCFHSNQVQPVSILEWIQTTASDLGIEFCLNSNLEYDGKKVYKFGASFICLYDKSTIFLKTAKQWKPVDLQDLLRVS